jgi:hypothetical protein
MLIDGVIGGAGSVLTFIQLKRTAFDHLFVAFYPLHRHQGGDEAQTRKLEMVRRLDWRDAGPFLAGKPDGLSFCPGGGW